MRTFESDQLCQDYQRCSCLVGVGSASGHPAAVPIERTVTSILAFKTAVEVAEAVAVGALSSFVHVARTVLEPTPERLGQW